MCQASRASSCGVARGDLDQRLGLAGDPHDRAVLEHEAVAVAQRDGVRQIEQKGGAAFARQHDAAAMALVGIEHHAIDRGRRVPAAGRSDLGCALHGPRPQNKK